MTVAQFKHCKCENSDFMNTLQHLHIIDIIEVYLLNLYEVTFFLFAGTNEEACHTQLGVQ